MKEQIQKKIRQNLDESMTILKRNMAKMMGLEHQAYDLWKSKNGDKYIWNKTRNTFDKYEVEVDDSLNAPLFFRDKIEIIPKTEEAKRILKGNTIFKVNDVKEMGDTSIPRLKGERGYQLRSSDNSLPLMLMWLRDGGDEHFSYRLI